MRYGKLLAVAGMITAISIVGSASAIAPPPGVDESTPNLPPLDGQYLSPQNVHAMYSGPALQVVLSHIQHKRFTQTFPPPPPGGQTTHTFGSQVDGDASINGGPDTPITGNGNVTVNVAATATPGVYDTEMLQLDLFFPGGIMIRESPTLASLGSTTETPNTGGFHIDSFFDVFTELSVDGGQSWIPSDTSTHVDLAPLPEPGSICLFGLAGAGMLLRRRRAA